jgi:hypothetical protein
MEAIRRIIKVKDNAIRIELPENYNNKTVELIILPAAEELYSKVEEDKVDYEKLYGSLNSGLTIDQIDEQLKALRSEWEKDIS